MSRNYDYGITKGQREVLEVFRAMPGITAKDAIELLPDTPKSTVLTAISRLRTAGWLVPNGDKPGEGGHKQSTLVVNTDPTTVVPTRKPRRRRKQEPTDAALIYEMQELKRKIAELEQWKAEAIDRFPDLAVPPLLIRARKLVAEELRATGDHALATQVCAGAKDTTLMVRVALKALEEGE